MMTKNFEMATRNIFKSQFSDLKVNATWSTVKWNSKLYKSRATRSSSKGRQSQKCKNMVGSFKNILLKNHKARKAERTWFVWHDIWPRKLSKTEVHVELNFYLAK
jgi:hypothetical protein